MLRFDENKPNKLTRDYEWESTENIIYKYDMAKHTDKEEDWATHRECKSNITALIEQTKRDKNSLDENNKSHRNVWQTINGIIGEAQMDRKIHCIGNYSDLMIYGIDAAEYNNYHYVNIGRLPTTYLLIHTS